MEIVAHGGAVGLVAEAGALLAVVGLWGWVWWRSRGAADDGPLAADDESAVQEARRDGE